MRRLRSVVNRRNVALPSQTRPCGEYQFQSRLLFMLNQSAPALSLCKYISSALLNHPQPNLCLHCTKRTERRPLEMAKTVRFRCALASCARISSANEDGLVLCKCKGRYYCNKTCRKANSGIHDPDCKTIEYLANPKNISTADRMIILRDPASGELAKRSDVLYHLILVIHREG
ncbi:hypothetical protein BU23DRAFT_242320 [Bimuria novae-zelandiae CBS 107.79]|uniref:MYND-type domain-containing protein n=1 Tax=Bimuria novae-zelandiae CBS 107.79 TaxID=1447943 RepID=A0A6A5V7N7_9PLEO|nr:hypothetical protein BU23DRAFT_242320 [Bimuria novae-zelandiae CBS 107.79]